MLLKSLKVKIAITIALLLFASVALTNFVLLRIVEQHIIDSHFQTGKQWINAFYAETTDGFEASVQEDSIEKALGLSGVSAIVYELETGTRALFSTDADEIRNALNRLAKRSVNEGKPSYDFSGSEWGIFWPRSKYLLLSVPLENNSGAGSVAINLSSDYQILRNAQQVAGGYLVINFLILLFIGVYRLTNLVTRPIHRLIRLTESYRHSGTLEFFTERRNDEFSRLSSSLNRMVHRIEDDRRELEQSLEAIEKANQDLKKAQHEIIRAEKLASIGRLSAGIAHEIGNPVGIVLGYLGLLRARIAPEDTDGLDYIDRAETEIQRINKIIRQLLDFSRPTPAGFTDFSIHDLLYEAGSMLQNQPMMENIRLYFDFAANPDFINADYNQLRQVFVNLIINAADSIHEAGLPEGGEIHLETSASTDGRWIRIAVSDNGCGISDEDAKTVFDPFYTTKETGKGTGLGLYVSYMIIEGAGGGICARQNQHAGARIVIHLPSAGKAPDDRTA